MKITHKLLFFFWAIIVCVWAISLYTVSTTKKDFKQNIINHDMSLAEESAGRLRHVLYSRIETVQEYTNDVLLQNELEKSHARLEQFDNRDSYVDEIDQQWKSESPYDAGPIFKELAENILSEELEEKKEYFQRKYGYAVYSDFLATNKYGVVAGLTSKTSGYRHDREGWWQKAKENSQYVGDVVFDKNSGIYSIDFAVRINNEEGEFLGVLKAVYDFEEINQLLLNTDHGKEHAVLGYYLVTEDGKLIHASVPGFQILQDVSGEEFFFNAKGEKGHYTSKDGSEFFVHVRVPGVREMRQPGWILIIPHYTEELFSPVNVLQKRLFLFASFATICVFFISMLTFKMISKPLTRLTQAVKEIGDGHLDRKVDIDSKDEIGELASAFNAMLANLTRLTVSRDRLVKEVEERLRVEKILADNEKFLSNVFDSIQDGICVLDKEMNLVRVNHTMREWYEHRMPLVGKKCYDAFHGTDAKCTVCAASRAFKSGGLEMEEVPLTMEKDGDRVLEVFGFPIRDESGVISGVVEYVRDITIKKQLETAVLESEKRLSGIIQSMLTAVVIIDAESFEVVDVNPAALNILGGRKEEVIGKKCYSYFCPAEKDKCPVLHSAEELDHSERVLINARGEEIPILKSVTTEVIGGRKCLIESFIDISARKKAEQEKERLISELQIALEEIKVLSGIVPICMHCKKIRDDKGYWNQLEKFISDHSEAQFSHSICEVCLEKFYPELKEEDKKN